MRRPANAAFTLVELLVVIGIIAVLISILLPALNKARAQANAAKCAANMRSAVQAVQIYASESKGWLPGPATSGVIWRSGGATIGANDVSTDTTPLQNMDWVSPALGRTFKWPENDYQRLRSIYNVDLRCPSNGATFGSIYGGGSLPYTPDDLTYGSYSAVIQFHAYPNRDGKQGLAPVTADMFSPQNQGLDPPAGYAPQINKVGSAASKVFLLEGSRYVVVNNEGTFQASAGPISFNAIRYQRVGGNFMIGGPYQPQPDTPYQLYEGGSLAYETKKISPIAKNLGWRHEGKMNLAFFDGHVEARVPADSIQVSLYVPKGTRIIKAENTYDPGDKDNQMVH